MISNLIIMRIHSYLLLFLIILLFAGDFHVFSQEADRGEVRRLVIEAYNKVIEIYNLGYNVTPIIDKLNHVLMIISGHGEGSPDQAHTIIMEFLNDYPEILDEAVKQRNLRMLYWTSIISVAIITLVVCYLYIPKIIWRLWLKLRGEYIVIVRKTRADRKSMYASDEVRAVILALIVVIGVFAFAQAYMAGRVVEPFSELGLLNENMKIGDYPTDVVVGQSVLLYIYVGNHMGYPVYYQVKVMVGDRYTDVDPAPLKPMIVFERIVMHNESWIFPLNISFKTPGINKRLIVELWIYNQTIGDFHYHKRWVQLWINVTKL